MALNRDLIGRDYPAPETYEVSRELIRRFASAIGETSPFHTDRDAARAAGYADVIAPPTFLTVLGFRFGDSGPTFDPELGLDYSRVVHGEQRFVHHRPVVAGDVLTVTTTVTDIRAAGGNEIMKTLTAVSDAAGEPVAELHSVLVSRGSAA